MHARRAPAPAAVPTAAASILTVLTVLTVLTTRACTGSSSDSGRVLRSHLASGLRRHAPTPKRVVVCIVVVVSVTSVVGVVSVTSVVGVVGVVSVVTVVTVASEQMQSTTDGH